MQQSETNEFVLKRLLALTPEITVESCVDLMPGIFSTKTLREMLDEESRERARRISEAAQLAAQQQQQSAAQQSKPGTPLQVLRRSRAGLRSRGQQALSQRRLGAVDLNGGMAPFELNTARWLMDVLPACKSLPAEAARAIASPDGLYSVEMLFWIAWTLLFGPPGAAQLHVPTLLQRLARRILRIRPAIERSGGGLSMQHFAVLVGEALVSAFRGEFPAEADSSELSGMPFRVSIHEVCSTLFAPSGSFDVDMANKLLFALFGEDQNRRLDAATSTTIDGCGDLGLAAVQFQALLTGPTSTSGRFPPLLKSR